MTRQDFFKKYWNFAQSATNGSGISPLLILSQAYLESGAGESVLAKKYNNFFGVKATQNWQGKTISLKTIEQDKQGKTYQIVSKFRVYNSPGEAFIEQIKFLNGDYNKRTVNKNGSTKPFKLINYESESNR